MLLKVLGLVLAGGKGTRLAPLTNQRAKPAVPFAGKYRIVDFVLSNLVNSDIHSIYVLVQFRSQSLLQHLRDGWQFDSLLKSQFVIPVPAQMATAAETWYRGTADAIYQNINLIEQSHPDIVVIFGADHVYRMNIREMIEYHVQKRSEVTVAAIPYDKKYSREFGVLETAENGRIVGFHEKTADAPTIPGHPDLIYASMGNYVFDPDVLVHMLREDAAREDSSHDFGKDILPLKLNEAKMFAYDFFDNRIPGEPHDKKPYWRDVGTIDAYYEANMDLNSKDPALNLYNREWPLRTSSYATPPAKFEYDEQGKQGAAVESTIANGCIFRGGMVQNSVLGRNVLVDSGTEVFDSIIFDNCVIGPNCKIRRAIIEKNVTIPAGTVIGYDEEADTARYSRSESGIVTVEGSRSHIDLTAMSV